MKERGDVSTHRQDCRQNLLFVRSDAQAQVVDADSRWLNISGDAGVALVQQGCPFSTVVADTGDPETLLQVQHSQSPGQ